MSHLVGGKMSELWYTCDMCRVAIENPKKGLVFHGNVYVADPGRVGGLIGNNFPKDLPLFTVESVRKTVLCHDCAKQVLLMDR